jgi:hypothetical protein
LRESSSLFTISACIRASSSIDTVLLVPPRACHAGRRASSSSSSESESESESAEDDGSGTELDPEGGPEDAESERLSVRSSKSSGDGPRRLRRCLSCSGGEP